MSRRIPRLVFAFLWMLSVASCSDAPSDAGAEPSTKTTGAVCGEGGTGFLVRSGGGGLIPFGAWVMFELGGYVAIDPSCRFAMSTSNGVMLGGTLTDAQAEELSAFLALEEWEALEPEYSRSCATHIGPTSFRWGRRSLELHPCSQLEPQPADFRHDLLELPGELFDRLEPWSEPLDGPMRYVLVDNSEIEYSDRLFQNVPRWPLGDPDAVAVVPTYDGLPPEARVANGEDAAQVREIRDAWVAEEIGARYAGFAPVVGPDGRRYELYARDVASDFEVEGGLVVPWLTTGRLHVTAVVFTEASAIDFTVYCGGASQPFAAGSLEDSGGSDERYWRGQVEDAPAGTCRVELNAIAGDGSPLDCVEYADVGSSATTTIRAGWSNGTSFRCGGR